MPISRTDLPRPVRGREWRRDLLLSWLFQTCITLQTSLNRRFLRFGMTLQEASVLLRCVEARKISPGQLSIVLGRDKGMITRFVNRLEARHFLTREVDRRDRRFSILKPTRKGKRAAVGLASIFDRIRTQLFNGISEGDIRRLGQMLPHLHKNAVRIGGGPKWARVSGRRRIGGQGNKSQAPEVDQLRVSPEEPRPVQSEQTEDVAPFIGPDNVGVFVHTCDRNE
jgi:DNA-binding MarR family transcriptional regulator